MDQDSKFDRLRRLHRDVQRWFWISVPGAIWMSFSLANEVVSGKLPQLVFDIAHRGEISRPPAEYLFAYVLPFIAWWSPFEVAEECMSALKSEVRRIGSLPTPYTPVHRLVNNVMKIAHDRSPLPE